MFILSKIIWYFLSPLNLLIALFLISFLFKILGKKFIYKLFLGIALCFFIVAGIFPTGLFILNKLENNHPIQNNLPKKIDGILILGGSVSTNITKDSNQVSFNESGERLTEVIKLIRIYNPSKIIYSGGSGTLNSNALPLTFVAKIFFSEMGIDMKKVIFESRSRNTYENILFSKEIIKPIKNEKWLLITSAFHMTRAINISEKLKLKFIPYPVDFRTRKNQTFRPSFFFTSKFYSI